jgi:hypothetical protein
MRRTFATTCGAAPATLVLLAVTAPSATADPHQVVEENPEPTVWCTGVTTDDSLIEFDLVTNAEGQVVRSSLEIIAAGWGEHLSKGVPLETTFTDGKIDAGFELRDPSGHAVGTARFVGTYTVGETVTTKDRWSVGNTQWHFVGSSTPYSLTWSSVELGHWQVGNLDCIAGAGESTTSFTAPHEPGDGTHPARSPAAEPPAQEAAQRRGRRATPRWPRPSTAPTAAKASCGVPTGCEIHPSGSTSPAVQRHLNEIPNPGQLSSCAALRAQGSIGYVLPTENKSKGGIKCEIP